MAMPKTILTGREGGHDITQMIATLTWSGDKNSIVRKVTAEVVYRLGDLPVPELGDGLTLTDGGSVLFQGYVVRRALDSEESKISITAYDRGVYLCNNQGTYKFRGITAEDIARTVCADYGIPVDSLASTGALLNRKFTGTALDKIITSAYTLAAEQTGERYAVRMTPAGLLVKVKEQSQTSLILRPRSNLIRASTTESIEKMVNSVAIYDEQGNRLSVQNDQGAIDLYGMMQRHITQRDGEDVSGEAKTLLEDGALAKTVTAQVLGNSTLITGETVIAEEEGTGLSGLFWIESDSHTWVRNTYQTRLTLNCRNVMTKTSAGSELK